MLKPLTDEKKAMKKKVIARCMLPMIKEMK
jgi:hypothetical protein